MAATRSRRRYGRRRGVAVLLAGSVVLGVLAPGAATSATFSPSLLAINCRGATFCAAAGRANSQPFVATRAGNRWSANASPSVTGGVLSGVECSSSTNCFAVGWRGPAQTPATLIEHWNGTTWQVVTSPNPAGSNELTSISCVSASFCVAAGWTATTNHVVTLVEHWNGTRWRIVPSPNHHDGPNFFNELHGVSCVSTKLCFAVGETASMDADETLIIRWNGTAWSISARQGSGNPQRVLYGVSCASATACMAAGQTQSDPPVVLLKDRWNGKTWSLTVGQPRQVKQDLLFNAVSCAAATACMAVGADSYDVPYAQRWNGSRWTRTAAPQPEGFNLIGVTCLTPDNCYAVGNNAVEQWHPGGWTTVATFS